MQYSTVILALMALSLVGCAQTSTTTTTTAQPSLVGTWRWISVDGRPMEGPFYVRYYSNGAAATWPAPKGWPTTTNGVSYGRYHLEGEFLLLETGAGKDDPKAHMEIRGDEMTLMNNESNRLVYRRVVPELAPGKTRARFAR